MRVRSFFRTLFRATRLDRELDDELQCAVDELAARYVARGDPFASFGHGGRLPSGDSRRNLYRPTGPEC